MTLISSAEVKGKKNCLLGDEARFKELFSISNLGRVWKVIRREAREHRVRDAIDCLDWAVNMEVTLPQLRERIMSGEYVPSPPTRYELAKSMGSYRVMTTPNFRDALVYRIICDRALELALPAKVKGAFFSRRHQVTPIGNTFNLSDDPYLRFFDIWLRYQEYRTRTLLNQPYEILVVSDITNYFESISIELLMEYLSPLGLPRKAIALLGKILDEFKPMSGHSPNPRIGIPVDEYDCSRELAHIFLFEHDRRVVEKVGEENYVRWMDDQNVGAESYTDARKVVNLLTRSLTMQRLTLNGGKSKFLNPQEVIQYFQLDANELLNKWEKKYRKGLKKRFKKARVALKKVWNKILETAIEEGHWDKVLKRLYGYSARCRSSLLDDRMYDDLLAYPSLDERIFESLSKRNEGAKLLSLFKNYCENGESLYEATEASFFEACMLLNAERELEAKIRRFALEFVKNMGTDQAGGPFGKASALLCLYWYGLDGDGIVDLFSNEEAPRLPAVVARAWLSSAAARKPSNLYRIQAKLLGNPGDDVARLSRFLDDLLNGKVQNVGKYKNLKPRGIKNEMFYDARAWLQLELISQGKSKALRAKAKTDAKIFSKYAHTRQEKRVLERILKRLKTTARKL